MIRWQYYIVLSYLDGRKDRFVLSWFVLVCMCCLANRLSKTPKRACSQATYWCDQIIYIYLRFSPLQGRQKLRGISRISSRYHPLTNQRSIHDVTTATDTSTANEQAKPSGETQGWIKRSARTRERLQPIGADSTHNPIHDSNNNQHKTTSVTGNEGKGVGLLSKRITSGSKGDANTAKNKEKDVEITVPEKPSNEGEKEGQFLPPIK